MIRDFRLSPNFTFYEFTGTHHADLLEENRRYGLQHLARLVLRARRMELYRRILGNIPIAISCGVRCPALNARVKGSRISQHLEALAEDWGLRDFKAPGDRLATFRIIEDFHESSPVAFGQLIYEKAQRYYGVATWLHTSEGAPFRPLAKCGQILTMEDGDYILEWSKDFAEWKLG